MGFERGILATREALLLDAVTTAPAGPAGGVRRLMLALLYRETERPDDARQVFDVLAHDDFRGLGMLPSWLYTLGNCAAVCAYLGDRERRVCFSTSWLRMPTRS